MREQIIHLDQFDDYHSARDKLGWARVDRVLVVWPKTGWGQAPPLQRRVELTLVHRHTSQLGAHLGFVNAPDSVADHAADMRIPTFNSVEDSHLFNWGSRLAPRGMREPHGRIPTDIAAARNYLGMRPPAPRWQTLLRLPASMLLAAGALAAVGAMLLVALPTAELRLQPATQQLTASIELEAVPGLDAANGRTIPATTRTVEVSASSDTLTTATFTKAEEYATGNVLLTNRTAQAVRVPAGSVARTTDGSAIKFVLQQDVALPARAGASAQGTMRAVRPGPAGNVAANLINSMEGYLADLIVVTNQATLAGGEVKQLPAVASADLSRLQKLVEAELVENGYAQLAAALPASQFAPQKSARITRVFEATFSNAAGEPAEMLSLLMRAAVSVTVVDEQQLHAVGLQELEQRVGADLVLLPDSVSYSRSTEVLALSEGRAAFTLTARGTAGPQIDARLVQQAVRWQPVAQAPELIYKLFPIVQRPSLAVWPAWLKRTPWLAWRTRVLIGTETDARAGS